MKVAIRSLIILFCLLFLVSKAAAQDFEQWRQQQERQFQEFKNEQDAAFLKMLQDAWEVMEMQNPYLHFDEPKPDLIPEADWDLPSGFFDLADTDDPVTIAREIPLRRVVLPRLQVTEIPEQEMEVSPIGFNRASFNFFSVDVPYIYRTDMMIRLLAAPSQESLTEYWADMARSDYQWYIDRIRELQESLEMNDWATLKAVNRMGRDLYGNSVNDIRLFSWFVMTKLGYDVKAAFNRDTVFILCAFDRRVVNTQFLLLEGRRYYSLQLESDSGRQTLLTSYRGVYEGIDRLISLQVDQLPLLPENNEERNLSFYWDDELHSITVSFNRNVIDFYRRFPSTELDVYIDAGISDVTRKDLVDQLGALVDGRSELEAVSMLLRFVQTAFDYKTDREQFGGQKYMIPEELFYYPYSDCDDRTVLMAFLVRELLGIETIALRYPNHLALAVKLKEPFGDTVIHMGSVYTVADPTYINAMPGMTMPQFSSVRPEIIQL